jgi:hypothetical protein
VGQRRRSGTGSACVKLDQWILHLLKSIEQPLIKYICTHSNTKFPVLFGSKVIDLLECIWVCEKDITVDIDSGGWCYIKGEYKVEGIHPSQILCCTFGPEPLTLDQQIMLQNILWDLARSRNKVHLVIPMCYEIIDDFPGGLHELNPYRIKDVSFHGYHRKLYAQAAYIIFKVDLKCRKDLTPVELLRELPKEQPYEDNEEESSPGAHTV